MNTQTQIANQGTQKTESFVAEPIPGSTTPTHGQGQTHGSLKADTVIVDPIPPTVNPFSSLKGYGGTSQPPEPEPPLAVPGLPGLEPLPGFFPPKGISTGHESGEADDFRPMPADCHCGTAEQEEYTLLLRTLLTEPKEPNPEQRDALESRGRWKKNRARRRRAIKGFFQGVGDRLAPRMPILGAVIGGIGDGIRENGRYEVVIGPDERQPIFDTTVAPFSGCTQLDIVSADGREYVGSASCIAVTDRFTFFLTAAHCVYFHDGGGTAKTITVSPGRDGDVFPFGRHTFSPGTDIGAVYIPDGWVQSRARSADWALIIVEHIFTDAEGQTPFVFDVKAFEDFELASQIGQVCGYPVDFAAGMDSTLPFIHADEVSGVYDGHFTYLLDTTGGQSGSPFWFFDADTQSRTIAGVHTMGDSAGNSATRITPEIVTIINDWIEHAKAA